MKKNIRPSIIRTADATDGAIVRVPALCGRTCRSLVRSFDGYAWVTMDAADYDRICEEVGRRFTIRLNASIADQPYFYVRLDVSKIGTRQVAHIVLHAGRGVGVSYVDGNPLNLRRSNLMVRSGRSKGDTQFLGATL